MNLKFHRNVLFEKTNIFGLFRHPNDIPDSIWEYGQSLMNNKKNSQNDMLHLYIKMILVPLANLDTYKLKIGPHDKSFCWFKIETNMNINLGFDLYFNTLDIKKISMELWIREYWDNKLKLAERSKNNI